MGEEAHSGRSNDGPISGLGPVFSQLCDDSYKRFSCWKGVPRDLVPIMDY